MTALDIIVLFLIGAGAIFGFMRGFVQEALSLIAWLLIIAAIRLLHGPVTGWLAEPVGTQAGAAVLAFLAILVVSYALGKWIAKSIGSKSRQSVLGPVDRVLGFGFGMLKGLIGATLIFLLLVMGYETIFGGDEKRPDWMTQSRTYPLLNASGEAMSAFVRDRRESADAEESEEGTRLYRHSTQAGAKMGFVRDPERSVLHVREQRKHAETAFAALHQLNVDTA